MDHKVSFVKSSDGVRIAYAISGNGPPLVRAATWLTHIEHDWKGPIWSHWNRFLSESNQLTRYDPRGCGLSEREVEHISVDHWVDDFATVVDHLGLEKFSVLGVSQGGNVALKYAARFPDRVKKLIIMGTTPVSWRKVPELPICAHSEALIGLAAASWGDRNPAFRKMFANLFVPEAKPEHVDWFAKVCKQSATKEVAASYLNALGDMDMGDAMAKVAAADIPTLVLHCIGDAITPIEAGRMLAAELPNAQFVTLESNNHILLESEPAWQVFCESVAAFLSAGEPHIQPPDPRRFDTLTKREDQILRLVAKAWSNGQIAESLFITEKTVRNHVTNILDKIGVDTRAKAIVLAKDMGY